MELLCSIFILNDGHLEFCNSQKSLHNRSATLHKIMYRVISSQEWALWSPMRRNLICIKNTSRWWYFCFDSSHPVKKGTYLQKTIRSYLLAVCISKGLCAVSNGKPLIDFHQQVIHFLGRPRAAEESFWFYFGTCMRSTAINFIR